MGVFITFTLLFGFFKHKIWNWANRPYRGFVHKDLKKIMRPIFLLKNFTVQFKNFLEILCWIPGVRLTDFYKKMINQSCWVLPHPKNRTLDAVFSRFLCVSFTITMRKQPKGVTRSRRRTVSLSVFFLRRQVSPLGYCLRVIVNVTHRNLDI